MYINFWYPMIESAKLNSDKPELVQALGHKLALFRDGEGNAHCVSDTCVHRAGSLGLGKIRDGNIECPYHGWQFDGTGACKMIPSIGKDGKVPARAKVDAYPVQEKYGIVFAYLGDLPAEERPSLMPIDEYDEDNWRANLIVYDVACNYERSIENGLDPAHNEFVHPTHGHEGDRDDYVVPEYELDHTEWGAGFMTTFIGKERPEYETRTAFRTDSKGNFRADTQAGTYFHGPAQMLTKIHLTEENWMHQYMYECPIDEGHIRIFLVNMRNCLLEPERDSKIVERCLAIAEQDIIILTKVDPIKTPDSMTCEVMVPADKILVHYRHCLDKWDQNGWRIDASTWRRRREDKNIAFSIPSPARRTEKNWVLDAVPLLVPDKAEKIAAQ
jgi:phenylpropionate dioxygenase-like ring-hydroxylating dioxygenase large terminal subunit